MATTSVTGSCPGCCPWWCINGTPPGCMSVRLGTIEGDPPCPDCTGPDVGGPDDPHQTVYTICPDGSGGWAGDGCTFTEDPLNPGDWILVACGITYLFVDWPGFPGVAPVDVGSQGGPVDQPGPCTTNGAATIFRNAYECFFGTETALLAEIANVQMSPVFNYYGYSGPFGTEALCEDECPPASPSPLTLGAEAGDPFFLRVDAGGGPAT